MQLGKTCNHVMFLCLFTFVSEHEIFCKKLCNLRANSDNLPLPILDESQSILKILDINDHNDTKILAN